MEDKTRSNFKTLLNFSFIDIFNKFKLFYKLSIHSLEKKNIFNVFLLFKSGITYPANAPLIFGTL